MLRSSLAFALVLVAACSSSDDTTPNGGTSGTATPPDGVVGDIRESVTWEDGTKLAGVIRIVEGTTVTIAPGAKITCSDATNIQIGGTLKVSAKDNHAKISCAKWTGVTVASKGKLDIDGLDIENAAVGYQTTAEAADSVVKNSKITTCVRPFVVGEKSKLTLDHVEASVPTTVGAFDKSYVEVFGTLEAHYLKYEAQGNEGIMTREGGSTTITDSTLTAHGGQDLVSSYGGDKLEVSYSTMSGAHCGVHLQGVKVSATFDHITSTGNLFGVTVYGAATATVKNSNLSGSIAWLDIQGDHGDVFLGENNFIAPNSAGTAPNAIVGTPIPTDPPKSTPTATAQIQGAAPRPEGSQ
jgi:predicted heme/steroid binding protein